ncbi:MAG: FtsX-like permease family protein [Chryseolinea sp.]
MNGSQRTVYFLSVLAIFILVVAWINYINLSTAKALERSKEVGLRKVVGATRKQLLMQFLFDSAVINFLGVTLAIVIVVIVWRPFESLVGKEMMSILFQDSFNGSAAQWLIVFAVFLSGVLLVGIYPALVLSSFNPAHVLKGRYLHGVGSSLLRKLMITFQYGLAVLLLSGTVIIYLQLNFMRSQDPGFAKDQIVVLEAPAVYDSTARNKIIFFQKWCADDPWCK